MSERKLSIEHKALLVYIDAYRDKLADPDMYAKGKSTGAREICKAIGIPKEKLKRIRNFYRNHDRWSM